jgi:hypothetical protein
MLNNTHINQFLLQICLAMSLLKNARMLNMLAFFWFPRLRAFLPKSVSKSALNFFSMLLLLHVSANAADISNMKTVGKGELSFMFWTAYDAELLAPEGQFQPDKSFALKLAYKMDFTGQEIAERSVEEMKKQGAASEIQLKKWGAEMLQVFPDVKEGDSITGIKTAEGNAVFLHNDKEIGAIIDPDFTKAFFDIWLSQKTSEPSLRQKLLAVK